MGWLNQAAVRHRSAYFRALQQAQWMEAVGGDVPRVRDSGPSNGSNAVNQKQAKRLRKSIKKAAEAAGVRISDSVDTTYIRGLVPSKRFNTTVDGKLYEDSAPQIRVAPDSARAIYKRVKRRVSSNRRTKRSRILPGIQLRPTEASGAMEHTGAEGVQQEHGDVS